MLDLLPLSAPCSGSGNAAPEKPRNPSNHPKQPADKETTAITSVFTTLPYDERCPIVIDVRTQLEWDEGHAPCAHRLEIQNDPGLVAKVEALANGDRSHPVQVYCRSGNRSGQAQKILKDRKWTHVTNAGGWQSGQADAIKKLCDCKTRSKDPSKNLALCQKCGTGKSGEPSCCARGGNWFKKCGNPGDARFAHTWDEGMKACRSKSIDRLCSLHRNLPFFVP